jgi:hypothetical protein
MSENDVPLRARARVLIQSDRLPRGRPEWTGGGPGEGACCALCDLPVSRDELEVEIEFAREGRESAGGGNYRFHVRCFTAWELACRDVELVRASSATVSRLPETSTCDKVAGHARSGTPEPPPHSHAGIEELHLLDGELWIDDRKLYPGDYNRAEPGSSDARVWSETGCTCVLITSTRDVLR